MSEYRDLCDRLGYGAVYSDGDFDEAATNALLEEAREAICSLSATLEEVSQAINLVWHKLP